MTLISKLWEEKTLPIKDALYYGDGRSFFIKLKNENPTKIEIIEEFDLEDFYGKDRDWVTSIDITKEFNLTDGSYFCCGDGSNGSEGFFALLSAERKILWLIYLEFSNPFYDFYVEEHTAVVKSTSGLAIKINLKNPML
jgi:hypothetical protein